MAFWPKFLLLLFFCSSISLSASLFEKEKHFLVITPSSPYEEGKEQGSCFQKEIQIFCHQPLEELKEKLVLRKIDWEKLIPKIEKKIAKKYRQEMQGIADGAQVSYREILLLNILPEILSTGCSIIGVSENETPLFATNHFPSLPSHDQNSNERWQNLQKTPLSASFASLKKALEKVSLKDTIQAMIFDVERRSLYLAFGSGFAGHLSYSFYSGNRLFSKNEFLPSKKVFLARTLDWPMPLLGSKTILLIRKHTSDHFATAIVTWPGFIGALSGLNEEGLCLAISAVIGQRQVALPNSLFFRELLEKSSSVAKASSLVQKQKNASAMNLLIGGADGLLFAELDPARNKTGPALIKKMN